MLFTKTRALFLRYFAGRSSLPVILLLFGIVLAISSHSLLSANIDDLDSAHHIMDGMFFRDLVVDFPLVHPVSYTLQYYRQYPALGFLFWPPLFPALEGAAFLVGGLDMRVPRFCILLCGFVLALTVYRIVERRGGRMAAFTAALLLVSTPLIAQLYNQVMLEVPALMMVFLTIAAYERLFAAGQVRWTDAALFAIVAAAAAYTKQTIVFLYPALLLDAVVNHRAKLGRPRIWAAVILVIVLLAPLALFTVQFGKANLEQSLGTDKTYVFSYHPPDRWTIASWTYYPGRLAALLGPAMLLLGLGGLLYACFDRAFLKANLIWMAWIGCWYVLFSLFLNKQDRYAAFWIPAWIILAICALGHFATRVRWRWLYVIPLLIAAVGFPTAVRAGVKGYSGMEEVVRALTVAEPPYNIAYFGQYRQLLVPFIRRIDNQRRIFTLQGDRIIEASGTLPKASHDYQLRYIVVEHSRGGQPAAPAAVAAALDSPRTFQRMASYTIDAEPFPIQLDVYRYAGPVARHMAQVPLRSRLISTQAAKTLL